MAGLLDFLNSDDARLGIGLLSAGGPQTDPTETGFGRAMQRTMAGVDARKQAELERQYKQSMMMENVSQADYRASQNALARYNMEMDAYMTGASTAPPRLPAMGGGAATSNLGLGTTPGPAAVAQGTQQATPTTAAAAPAATGVPQQPGDGAGQRDAQGMPVVPVGGGFKPLPQIAQETGIPLQALVTDWKKNGGKNVGEWIMKASGPIKNSVQMVGDVPNQWVDNGKGGLTLVPAEGALPSYAAGRNIQERAGARYRMTTVMNDDGSTREVPVADVVDANSVAGRGGGAPASGGAMQATAPQVQGTLGMRNNNPGNLRPPGQSTGFQQFATPEEGIAALDRNLQNYGTKGVNTVAGVISKWAPPNENNTAAYIDTVSKKLGLGPNDKIDLSNPYMRHALSAQIMLHENGPQIFRAGGAAPTQGAEQPPAQQQQPGSGGFVKTLSPQAQARLDASAAATKGVGELVKKRVEESDQGAQGAQKSLETMDRIEEAAKGGKIFLGTGANQRLTLSVLGETLGVAGKDTMQRASNTAAVMRDLANLELSYAQQTMKGQGQITDPERALLKRAASGDIANFTPTQMRDFIAITRKTANNRIERHNQLLSDVESGAAPTTILRVGGPGATQPAAAPGAAPTAAAPTAAQQIAKGAKTDPTGSNWLGNGSPESAIAAGAAAVADNPKARPIVEARLRKLGLTLPGSTAPPTTVTGSW